MQGELNNTVNESGKTLPLIYTREELSEKVRVPAVVEQDLKSIISERLEQCGLYFRVFSRTKTAASMEKKFQLKQYGVNGDERRLQDLIGVRINLYFDDDVSICRHLMENTFNLLEWSTSERNDDEFKPIKLNGVFQLPEYLAAEISPETWDMHIDRTFEIQIKTMFFEGWHEIEHDMRYKGEELWVQFPGSSRYFNSILATLELCDKSMVTLFEDMGHALYKSGQWVDMIRCHFRLKMEDTELYPEVARVLDKSAMESSASLGKQIYRTSKKDLVNMLAARGARKIPINVNTIIATINDNKLHDPELKAIFKERDVYNDGCDDIAAESHRYELLPLKRHAVFQMKTVADGSRLHLEEPVCRELIFQKCAEYAYNWAYGRFSPFFGSMPQEISNWKGDIMGYHVTVEYEPANMSFKMHARHLDMEVAGRIWYTEACLEANSDVPENGIGVKINNGYAEPAHETMENPNSGMFFSYPGFYKAIVDNVGVFSGISCFNRRRILQPEQLGELNRAIDDPANGFPIVLIISKKNEEALMDESWLGAFRVSDFTRTVWRYAHVFTCYEETGRKLLAMRRMPNEGEAVPKLYIFWPDGGYDTYSPEYVKSCSFGRHLEARDDARTYDIVHGGQAFYHKIVTELRSWNVNSGMWEGYRRETATELN